MWLEMPCRWLVFLGLPDFAQPGLTGTHPLAVFSLLPDCYAAAIVCFCGCWLFKLLLSNTLMCWREKVENPLGMCWWN